MSFVRSFAAVSTTITCIAATLPSEKHLFGRVQREEDTVSIDSKLMKARLPGVAQLPTTPEDVLGIFTSVSSLDDVQVHSDGPGLGRHADLTRDLFQDESRLMVKGPAVVDQWAGEWHLYARQFSSTIFGLRTAAAWAESSFPGPFTGGTRRDDVCPMGQIGLVEFFGESGRCNVYRALAGSGDPREVVVKYGNDCVERRTMPGYNHKVDHPLVKEFAFLSVLNHTSLVPATYYVSPASPLQANPGASSNRALTRQLLRHYPECYQRGTEVRLLVQDHVGPSVQAYFDWLLESLYPVTPIRVSPVLVAFSLLKSVIVKLRAMHELGIVHGDVHASNVLFGRKVGNFALISRADWDKLVFIDFELSVFFPARIGTETDQEYQGLNESLFSPWQLRGERLGPRDDLFRAFDMVAQLLSRGSVLSGVKRILQANLQRIPEREYPAMRRTVYRWFRESEPMFLPSVPLASEFGRDMGVSSDRLRNALMHLESAVSLVRSINHPDRVPPYNDILALVDRAVAAISTN